MAEVAVYSSRVFLAHSFFLLAKEDAMALRLLSKFCTATLYVCPALANVEDLQRWERNDTCLHGTHHSGGSSSTPEKQKVSREPGLLSLSGSWLVFLKYKSSHVFYTWVGGGDTQWLHITQGLLKPKFLQVSQPLTSNFLSEFIPCLISPDSYSEISLDSILLHKLPLPRIPTLVASWLNSYSSFRTQWQMASPPWSLLLSLQAELVNL